MPVICLVRHGQASFGAADYDVLSELGRAQSGVVGRELARRGLRDPLVACGSLRRQRDTAALLAEAAGFAGAPREDPRWDEYDHLDLIKRYVTAPAGSDDDSRAVQHLLDVALDAWIKDAASDGWDEFAGGAVAALDELAAELEGRDAVVVTSGGVLAAVCGSLLGADPAGVVALNRVTVNGAITTVVVGRSGTSLLSFNDHSHLVGEHRALLTYR